MKGLVYVVSLVLSLPNLIAGMALLVIKHTFSTRDPLKDYRDINYELEMYDKAHADKEDFNPLRNRPQWVVLNKIDVIEDKRVQELIAEFKAKDVPVRTISAVCGHGTIALIFPREHVGEIFVVA